MDEDPLGLVGDSGWSATEVNGGGLVNLFLTPAREDESLPSIVANGLGRADYSKERPS